MSISVIIPAAGVGRRLRTQTPKQFLKLGTEPILVHTIKRITEVHEIEKIVVALPRRKIHFLTPFIRKYRWKGRVYVVAGGQSRQDSVYKAFKSLQAPTDLVLVHDGVRPFVDKRLIREVIAATYKMGAAAPAISLTDTLKKKSPAGHLLTAPRDNFLFVQTPQGFRTSILAKALEKARRESFQGTDESTLVEKLGYPVALVPGSEWNIKITHPLDLILAKAIVSSSRFVVHSLRRTANR